MSELKVRLDSDEPNIWSWNTSMESGPTFVNIMPALGNIDLVERLQLREDVRGVCLFGSAARGEADADSDLDLLVVTPNDAEIRAIRMQLKRYESKGGTQIRLMTEDRLRESFRNRTVFATHLAREAQVFGDRDGVIRNLFEQYPKDSPVEEDGRSLRARLKAYDDLAWCGGRYLLCLADLHAWGRSGAMLALARLGRFEFAREQVFPALVSSYPELECAASEVSALRPFWLVVRRRQEVELPFSPVDSHDETARARDACRQILSTVP